MSASTSPPIPMDAPAKIPPPHDPSSVVQRAWSVLRLTRLQEVVQLTIVELQSLPRPEPIEPGPAGASSLSKPSSVTQADWNERLPAVDALRACCDELREASGMSGAHSERIEHLRAVRQYMQQQPSAWSAAFRRALEEYRRAAAVALQTRVARAAAA